MDKKVFIDTSEPLGSNLHPIGDPFASPKPGFAPP